MTCLNPPLSRKPSKGFAWQCAGCFKKDPRNASLSTSLLHKEKEKRSTSPAAASTQSPANSDKTESASSQPSKSTSSNKVRPIQTRTTRSQTESQTGTPSRPTSPTPPRNKTPATNGAKASGISQKNIISSARRKDPNKMHTTHMWPFRYFGIHTNVKDILGKIFRLLVRALLDTFY